MALAHPVGTASYREEFAIREIGLQDLRIAMAQGWGDFLSKRGDIVFIGLVYPVAVVLAAVYAFHASILPLIFPLIAGSVLFGPAVASGFYELARRRERHLDTRWRHFFDVLRGPAAFQLFALTSIVVLLFLLWLCAAWVIYSLTLGSAGTGSTGSVSEFLNEVLTTSAGWQMILFGNLVGFGFAVLVLAVSVISFPMLIDQPVPMGIALRTSLRVVRKSPVTVAAWGLIVVLLLTLGALPALVGLAIVFPVLGYATWHLYTRAVVR